MTSLKWTIAVISCGIGVLMFQSISLTDIIFNNEGLPIQTNTFNKADANSPVNHDLWDGLLKKYVAPNGNVNYKGFLNDRNKLTEYINYLSAQEPSKSWNKNEFLAFYINAYNAYTVDLILENYPTQSIKNISKAWTRKIVSMGGEKISLGDLEHGILRKMNEPRIHFAINCASYSCPKLINEAFTATKIEMQLEKVTREFINSTENKISEKKLELSKIFQWYKDDFVNKNTKTLIEYIQPYVSTELSPKAKIKYLKYNWALNE